jgi:hypothetical protein
MIKLPYPSRRPPNERWTAKWVTLEIEIVFTALISVPVTSSMRSDETTKKATTQPANFTTTRTIKIPSTIHRARPSLFTAQRGIWRDNYSDEPGQYQSARSDEDRRMLPHRDRVPLGRQHVPVDLRVARRAQRGHGTVESIALLAGHDRTATTESVYRHEIRPALIQGAEVMDKIFG